MICASLIAMDLKTVFSSLGNIVGQEREVGEQFLAVKISATEVAAATWKVASDKVQLGEVSQAELMGPDLKDLLETSDKALSVAPETVKKVIFGLPFHWVSNGKIVPGKLDLLRQLCKELDLAPLGYVLLSEALENYYKEVEGAPLTAILLEIDGEEGLVTMYRAGKNLGTAIFDASTSELNTALEKALKEFRETEILPSRIIIYDGKKNLDSLAEKMTAFPWTKTLPFLHFPKVEVFGSYEVVKALAVAGGMQMGGHFELEGKPEEEVEPPPEEEKLELEEVSAEEAGFLPEMSPASFGQLQELETPEVPEPVSPPTPVFTPGKTLVTVKEKLSSLVTTFFAAAKKIPLPSLPKLPSGGIKTPKIIPLVVIIAVLGLFLFGLALYQLPRATILLHVSSPPFDKELAVTVVTEKSTKPATDSAKAITGTFVDVSEVGSKKGVATGHKLVGDKAKGTVTIYSASSAHTFAAGSTLTSPAGLKFTLDKEVAVASGDAITRATVTSPVTAADIGDKYNLAAGTKFTIGSLSTSDYAAQADQALSGGSSHEATVITKEDQSRLLATLSAELTNQAQTDLVAKLSPGQKLLPNAVASSVSKKKFSKDVDAEGDTVSLDLTIDFEGVVFAQNDLVEVFAKNYTLDIPTGFYLEGSRATIDIKEIKTDKSGNATMRVHLVGGLLPKIDTTEILRNISGKSASAASRYLSQIPGAGEVTIDVTPKFFSSIIKFALPWKQENLKLEIVSQ